MPRYIDAEQLEKIAKIMLEDAMKNSWDGGHKEATWKEVVRLIKESKTADVVEVVRCRDCEYSSESKHEGQVNCYLMCSDMAENDFCSYGNRKAEV